MSNFYCSICNTAILEDENGEYCTGCKHYPLNTVKQELKRVSKLPFDRPPMVWYKRFINWLIK